MNKSFFKMKDLDMPHVILKLLTQSINYCARNSLRDSTLPVFSCKYTFGCLIGSYLASLYLGISQLINDPTLPIWWTIGFNRISYEFWYAQCLLKISAKLNSDRRWFILMYPQATMLLTKWYDKMLCLLCSLVCGTVQLLIMDSLSPKIHSWYRW